MKPTLTHHLVCPRCSDELQLRVFERDADEILQGDLTCARCSQSYAIRGGIPRFVDADTYASTFSRQRLYVRRHFGSYLGDRSGDKWLTPSTGFTCQDIRDGISLEVGCGYGRYLDTLDRWGGEVIGIDLSTHSVEMAFDFVGRRKRVHIVQCDLFQMPFRKHAFDRVFSIGVLHHTPSTHEALAAIADYAKPGGKVAVWVYDPVSKRSSDRLRKLTVHLPPAILYPLCILNQACFAWVRALPGGWRFNRILPGADPRLPFWRRVMGDFDNLSPKYAHVHAPDEVAGWFEELGFQDIRQLDRKSAAQAVSPA